MKLTQFLRYPKTVVSVIGVVLLALEGNTTWPFVTGQAHLPELVRILFRGLGDACIIAVILVLIFDEAAKRRFLEEVMKDASVHILGWLLPQGLREYIIEQLRINLVRKSWTITYTITSWPEQPEYIKLETDSKYTMENRSSFPQDYNCSYEVEKSLFPQIGEAKIVQVTGVNLDNRKECFKYPDTNHTKGELSETVSNITYRRVVTIPVHYEFTLKSVECFRDGSIVPFFATYPVLSTTLTVLYPVDRMNVFVDLSFGNIEGDQPTLVPGGKGKEWVFRSKPMLPGQGFTVRFARLPDTGTQAGI